MRNNLLHLIEMATKTSSQLTQPIATTADDAYSRTSFPYYWVALIFSSYLLPPWGSRGNGVAPFSWKECAYSSSTFDPCIIKHAPLLWKANGGVILCVKWWISKRGKCVVNMLSADFHRLEENSPVTDCYKRSSCLNVSKERITLLLGALTTHASPHTDWH